MNVYLLFVCTKNTRPCIHYVHIHALYNCIVTFLLSGSYTMTQRIQYIQVTLDEMDAQSVVDRAPLAEIEVLGQPI